MKKLSPLLIAFTLAGCRCEEPPPSEIAPQIYVDVCKTPQRKVEDKLIGGFKDCEYAFGSRDLSVKVSQAFKVTNPSIVELTFLNVEIIGDPAFHLELVPDTIGA